MPWLPRLFVSVILGAAGLVMACCAHAGATMAQLQPPPGAVAADPAPPPLSNDCQTPGVTISGATPLPNVQRALRETKVVKILTIGASASAMMRNAGESYFKVIEGVLERVIPGVDIQIIDRGVSGELVRDAAERIKSEVALSQPDLVLWQVGSSDAIARVPASEFETFLDEGVAWLKDHRIDVALVGLQYVRSLVADPQYQAIRAAVSRVGDKHQVLRISRYEATQVIEQARAQKAGEVTNEFTVSEQGHACLSEYVVRAITTGIFLRPIRPR